MNSKNLVATVLFLLTLTLLALLPPLGFFFVIQVCIVVSLFEFYTFNRLSHPWIQLFLGSLISCSFLLNAPWIWPAVLCLVLIVYTSGHLFPSSPTAPENVRNISITLLGWLYIPFLMGHFTLIRFMPNGKDLTLILFLLTVLRNICSGLLGRYIRGHAISKFSPKKTYEGALVGCFISTGLVSCLGPIGLSAVPFKDVFALGMGVGVLGQAGDLVESMFKRAAGVQSSSGALLGQGGMLDTIDSFAFTAPAAYYYLVAVSVLK